MFEDRRKWALREVGKERAQNAEDFNCEGTEESDAAPLLEGTSASRRESELRV
jgi:hypothetical protein